MQRINRIIWLLVGLLLLASPAWAVQYARPSGTVSAGGWSYSTSSLYEDTDETSANGDTDYAEADSSDTTMNLSLSAVTDPDTSTGHILRVWGTAVNGSGGPEKIDVALYQGATPIETCLSAQALSDHPTYTEYSCTLSSADSITDYSALRVLVTVNSLGSGENIRITMVELEVPDALTHYTMPADSASFTETGTAVGLLADRTLLIGEGSFSYDGPATTKLLRGYVVDAASGSYSESGTAASFDRDYVLTADAGNYSIPYIKARLGYGTLNGDLTGCVNCENFLKSYTETDSQGDLAVEANKITATDACNAYTTYLIKDFGSGYFDDNFKHEFIVNPDEATDLGNNTNLWTLSETAEDPANWGTNKPDRYFFRVYNGAGSSVLFSFMLYEYVDETAYYVQQTSVPYANAPFYVTVWRDLSVGTYGTLYVKVWDNSDPDKSGTPYWSDSITLHKSVSLRGFYPLVPWSTCYFTGWVADYNLNEVGIDGIASAEVGNFMLTDTYFSAALQNYSLTVDSGSFDMTGSSAGVLADRQITASTTSYSFTGSTAGLLADRNVQAGSESFAFTGTAAGVLHDFLIPSDSGGFSLNGTVATFPRTYVIASASGSFTFNGSDVTLTYGATGSYLINALSGTFQVTGTASGLLKDSKVPAGSGTFSVAGTDTDVLKGWLAQVDSGSFSETGSDNSLLKGSRVGASGDTFGITGSDIDFHRTYVLNAEAGTFSETGTVVGFNYSGASSFFVPERRTFMLDKETRDFDFNDKRNDFRFDDIRRELEL